MCDWEREDGGILNLTQEELCESRCVEKGSQIDIGGIACYDMT